MPTDTEPTATALVDEVLARFHAPLHATLPDLAARAAAVERELGGRPGAPSGLAAHVAAMVEALGTHLAKEEQILFPLIVEGRGPQAQMPIRVMLHEHEDHGVNLNALRALTGDYAVPAGAPPSCVALYDELRALDAALVEHIAFENDRLFPRALRG